MQKLNDIELDVAKEIINIGLAKSADSLSFFIRERVLIRSSDIDIKNIADSLKAISVDRDATYMIMTKIIGDVEGASYLILTQNEADKLIKLSIPADTINDPLKLEEMSNAMLLEVDNIITASVLTQFSNLLKFRMFGNVPLLSVKTKEEIDSQITNDLQGKEYLLSFKANFESDDMNFKPEFIWLLNTRFIEGVKEFIKDDPSLVKLKNLKIKAG